MNRRHLLGGLALAAAGIGTGANATLRKERPIFVLVHGAWHGGWCWERVVSRLHAAGHDSLAPTLPGLGARSGELSLKIDLNSHIADIAALVDRQSRPVALVGHSYGGFVISGVVDQLASAGRLRSVTYLDAFVPRDGERVVDYQDAAQRAQFLKAVANGDPVYSKKPARGFGISDPKDEAWVDSRLTDHPAATYVQPIHLKAAIPASIRRHYIHCTAPRMPVLDSTASRIRNESGWTFVELLTGHDAMVSAPERLTSLLLDRI
jgi:pimeloyl-ACP methyl ester carboxylesterase